MLAIINKFRSDLLSRTTLIMLFGGFGKFLSAITVLAVLMNASCSSPTKPPDDDDPSSNAIKIFSIEITDEIDHNSNQRLEVEVHLYDNANHNLLGCSGEDQGMGGVDLSDTRYELNALFLKPGSNNKALTYSDIENKTVFIWVIEDDFQSCPASVDIDEDDIIGRSKPFAGSKLVTPQVMQFEDVTHLRVGQAQ